jgi:hypothetical protein
MVKYVICIAATALGKIKSQMKKVGRSDITFWINNCNKTKKS